MSKLDTSMYTILLIGLVFSSYMWGKTDAVNDFHNIDNATEIEKIIQKVHNAHDYVKTENYTYVCSNYTIDAIKEIENLNKSNIHAYYVIAHRKDEEIGHAWVRVCQDYDVTVGLMKPDYERYDSIRMYKTKEENGTRVLEWSGEESWKY